MSAHASLVPVEFEWPSLAEAARTLTLRAGYNSAVVALGAGVLGVAAGLVGVFALLRKRALMTDALAHATLPGVAGAFVLASALGENARSLPVLLAGAAVSGVLGVLAVQGIVRGTRLREDAAIAIVLSVFFGLGVALMSHVQSMGVGGQGGIKSFIFGQTAAMRAGDAWLIAGAAAVVGLGVAVLFKEFRLVCFDQEFAGALGWRVSAIDLLMMAAVVLVTVIGLQAVGLILIVALVILPAASARFWTDRLWVMTVLAAVFGGMCGYLGACMSALFARFPAGAVIVLTGGAIFVVSLLAAPRRGVVAAVARHASLRLKIARQHALRAAYEAMEGAGAEGTSIGVEALRRSRSWGRGEFALVARLLRVSGLARVEGGALTLTAAGLEAARQVTRNHRLWEEYLITHADLAPSHVDRAADLVEHILSPELVARLEANLARRGPAPAGAPARSVHPIAPVDGAGGGRGARP